MIKIHWLITAFVLPVLIAGGCSGQNETTAPVVIYSQPQLRYRLLGYFEQIFWCDPYQYPVSRPQDELADAINEFEQIKQDNAEFKAILNYLLIQETEDFTQEEKLLIYRQHVRLAHAVNLTVSGDDFEFSLRVRQGQGEKIEGTITATGQITVNSRSPSNNTCPICLTRGTLIDTPAGKIPVEKIHTGMDVWALDAGGKRTVAEVIKTASTPVPSGFNALDIHLEDGRSLTASAAHPTFEGRRLDSYRAGEVLDGSVIESIEYIEYEGYTFDILPSGPTGMYWAGGILLTSTLAGS